MSVDALGHQVIVGATYPEPRSEAERWASIAIAGGLIGLFGWVVWLRATGKIKPAPVTYYAAPYPYYPPPPPPPAGYYENSGAGVTFHF